MTIHGSCNAQNILFEGIWLDIQTRVGTLHKILNMVWWRVGGLDGWFFQDILPLCGSILQAGTCQLWQYDKITKQLNFDWQTEVSGIKSLVYVLSRWT